MEHILSPKEGLHLVRELARYVLVKIPTPLPERKSVFSMITDNDRVQGSRRSHYEGQPVRVETLCESEAPPRAPCQWTNMLSFVPLTLQRNSHSSNWVSHIYIRTCSVIDTLYRLHTHTHLYDIIHTARSLILVRSHLQPNQLAGFPRALFPQYSGVKN